MADESGSTPLLDLVIDLGVLITLNPACFQKEQSLNMVQNSHGNQLKIQLSQK